MFYAGSYIFRSIRARSSNSSIQISDLYLVGLTNILTETERYAVGKTQSHLHNTNEALSFTLSQLCNEKKGLFGNLARNFWLNMCKQMFFCRHITFSNLMLAKSRINKEVNLM